MVTIEQLDVLPAVRQVPSESKRFQMMVYRHFVRKRQRYNYPNLSTAFLTFRNQFVTQAFLFLPLFVT
jgi:hypothetical protein